MTSQYTADLSDGFFEKLHNICTELECKPLQLLGVMFSESGVHAAAKNPVADANGILQFMGDTLRGLGWVKGGDAFRLLTAEEQLPYVRRYLAPHAGRLVSTAAIYTATFLPALVSHAGDPDYVLVTKGGQLGWAYSQNSSFDANHDYRITVGELDQAVCRNCIGPRWREIVQRATGEDATEVISPETLDLRTVAGIQSVLNKLGFDAGPVDGYGGHQTTRAVQLFQLQHGLQVDGIVGPQTREAMASAMAA